MSGPAAVPRCCSPTIVCVVCRNPIQSSAVLLDHGPIVAHTYCINMERWANHARRPEDGYRIHDNRTGCEGMPR